MKRLVSATLLVLTLAACDAVDTATQGFRHAREVAADVGAATGVEPQVGFHWETGSLEYVSVEFGAIPSGKSLDEIVEVTRRSVAKRFEQRPERILVSFSVPSGLDREE